MLPALEDEGPRPHGVLGESLRAELLHGVGRHDPRGVDREVPEERRDRPREREGDREGPRRLDLLDRRVELGVDEVRVVERVVLLEEPLEVPDHGVGIERGAVVELDALRELEGPPLPVGRDRPLLGERGLDLRPVVRVADERVVDVVHDGDALAVVGARRVERDRVAPASEDERPTVTVGRAERRDDEDRGQDGREGERTLHGRA